LSNGGFRRATRKHHSAEHKIRIVLEGSAARKASPLLFPKSIQKPSTVEKYNKSYFCQTNVYAQDIARIYQSAAAAALSRLCGYSGYSGYADFLKAHGRFCFFKVLGISVTTVTSVTHQRLAPPPPPDW
jgi:hypothetical protein